MNIPAISHAFTAGRRNLIGDPLSCMPRMDGGFGLQLEPLTGDPLEGPGRGPPQL